MRTWLLAGLSLLLLAVYTTGPACGFQQALPPAQSSAALKDSLNRAFQLIADGKFQEARGELERSQTLAAGPCGECLLGMAHVYASEKDWKRTKKTVRQALPLLTTPNVLARAYDQLGIAAVQSKDLDEAQDAFRRAASSGGAWGMLARYNLAELLLMRQHWAEAAETARSYLKDGGSAGTFLDQARIVLCQANSHQPDNPTPPPPTPNFEAQKVEGEVMRPEIILQTPPSYTAKARMDHVEGTVIVESIIDQEGCVRFMRALKGLPDGLTESALRTLQTWVFRPATLAGRPIKVYYVLTVTFNIQARPPH